jgi:hypothetical protein
VPRKIRRAPSADDGAGRHFILEATVLSWTVEVLPTEAIAPTHMTATRATIRPYSIAVDPDRFFMNFEIIITTLLPATRNGQGATVARRR